MRSVLDRLVQLHESIRIVYLVDCYQAQLWTGDDTRMVLAGRGDTIAGAMLNLESQAEGWTLDDVRRAR